MKLNQPAYAATSPVPGGRIAQQEACCRSGSIRATTYAKGLKDHPRHAEAVPTSFAPSVNFEILDMVERGDWVAVRWQLTATCDGLSSNIVRTGGSDGVMRIAQPLTATHAARGSRRARDDSSACVIATNPPAQPLLVRRMEKARLGVPLYRWVCRLIAVAGAFASFRTTPPEP